MDLKIKEEDKKFLIELSKKMNAQDKRGTSHVFFMVSALVRVYGDSGWCNEKENPAAKTAGRRIKSFTGKNASDTHRYRRNCR